MHAQQSRPVELIRKAIECQTRNASRVWFKEGPPDGYTETHETIYFQIFVHLSEEEKHRFTLACIPVAIF